MNNLCANPRCGHHRAVHHPIYPGFCRIPKCPCPRFVEQADLQEGLHMNHWKRSGEGH